MVNFNEKYEQYENLPKEQFELVGNRGRISDKKLSTKAVGYFGDAWIRFRKNKSSVVAAVIILLLFLYAIIVPFISGMTVLKYRQLPTGVAPLIASSAAW